MCQRELHEVPTNQSSCVRALENSMLCLSRAWYTYSNVRDSSEESHCRQDQELTSSRKDFEVRGLLVHILSVTTLIHESNESLAFLVVQHDQRGTFIVSTGVETIGASSVHEPTKITEANPRTYTHNTDIATLFVLPTPVCSRIVVESRQPCKRIQVSISPIPI
jgi:hypothetical protein